MTDRERFARVLIGVGVAGLVAALIFGVAGWILANRATNTVSSAIGPVAGIVDNVDETIEASLVLVANTTAAVESIENATRSTGRTLDSVADIVDQTAELAGGGIADGLDSAVESLPGLIDTSRVIDRTMRALSLVGVDYDPDVALDVALADLEASLRPLPNELRAQVALLETVRADVDAITTDAGDLAAILLDTRLDMMEAERVLRSASENAGRAAESVTGIEAELDTYTATARVAVAAATLALMAAASAPLIIGLHFRRGRESI